MSATCRERTCPLPATSLNTWSEPECTYHSHVFAEDWHEPAGCGHCGGRGEVRSLPHGDTDRTCRPCRGTGYADRGAGERYQQRWERRERRYRRRLLRHLRVHRS